MEETIELDFRFFTPEENMYGDWWKAQVRVKRMIGDYMVDYDWVSFNCDKNLTKEEIIEKITAKKEQIIEYVNYCRKLENSGFWWVE